MDANAYFFPSFQAAALAVHQLIGPPLFHLTWEIEEDCCALISHHFPDAINRGNILEEDAQSVAQLLGRHGPHGTALVLRVASLPRPDFSQINSSAQGPSGEEGSKFGHYANFIEDFEGRAIHRTIHHLTENVVFQQNQRQTTSPSA